MAVSAVIKIEQFKSAPQIGRVRDLLPSSTSSISIKESVFPLSGDLIFTHLPAVTNPVASTLTGWSTSNPENWSDSPTRQPDLRYRYRYAWGRDNREVFQGTISLGEDGQRWGNLDSNHGVLIEEEVFSRQGIGSVRQFRVQGSGKVLEKDLSFSGQFEDLRQLGKVSGDVDLELFPFLITALPVPFSTKNPIDTDVFIRLSNFTFPLASGTITLYLDGVLKTPLQIDEFFGGLGGFDVTWNNDFLFNYDAQVDVRWEFSDEDVPPNSFTIRYSFFTVPDLAGPRVINLVPDNGSTDIQISGPIQFDIVDFESGVDISTLVLYVNDLLIVNGDNGTIELTPFDDGTGYTVKVTPAEPWLYGDLIPVALFIKDSSPTGNELFFTYSFTTVESIEPRLLNISPRPCTVAVPTGTDIRVDVIDGGHGLENNSIVLTIEEIERESVILIPIVHRDD